MTAHSDYPETTDQTLLPPLPDTRALNGLKHGILSELVPAWEREGYAVHVQATRESLGAQSYIQQRLADRAALALWRLDRVARWEAAQMEADKRRFADNLQARQIDFSFGLAADEKRPIDALELRDSLKELAALSGESEQALLRAPDTVELVAADFEEEAATWALVKEQGDTASLTTEQTERLGMSLLVALQEVWSVDAARVARLMLGRKATREEVQMVADWDWVVEPSELPALVKEAARVAGSGWGQWLWEQRYAASSKAGKLRAVGARLPLLMEQEQARAIEPNTKRLDKIARYEAHLERVLYRALGELRTLEPESGGEVPD